MCIQHGVCAVSAWLATSYVFVRFTMQSEFITAFSIKPGSRHYEVHGIRRILHGNWPKLNIWTSRSDLQSPITKRKWNDVDVPNANHRYRRRRRHHRYFRRYFWCCCCFCLYLYIFNSQFSTFYQRVDSIVSVFVVINSPQASPASPFLFLFFYHG